MPPVLRPVMRSWAQSCIAAAPPLPIPAGDPVVVCAGADPDRVLLVGSGPAASPGAVDHETGLPGALARALALRTGRGAVVEARGAHQARIADLPALVGTARLQRFDALIVSVGVEDAAAGVSAARWRRSLSDLVGGLRSGGARDATVVLLRIPPVSSVGIYRGAPVLLADAGARRLNRAITRVERSHDGVVSAAVPPPGPAERVPVPDWYERCGRTLADLLHHRFGATPDR